MLFELKQAPKAAKIIIQAIKAKRPIPAVFANAPQLFPWLNIFKIAFDDLVGDRVAFDMPMTWMARQRWAETHGLDEEATELLHTHLRALDLAFLKWKADNRETQGGTDGRARGPSSTDERAS